MNSLRLLPASHATEVEPHVTARGGWVMTGLALELCSAALGRPQTLALCDDGPPPASAEDVASIRRVLEAAAAGPADLGGREADEWLTRLDAARVGGEVVDLNAPAPARTPRPSLAPRASALRWQADDGGES